MAERVVVVTGAASGIGAAIADRLSTDGWAVAAADIDYVDIEGMTHNDNPHRPSRRPYHVDVTSESSVQRMVDQVVRDFGAVDALVNSAGVAGISAPSWELPDGEWQRVISVNLTGTYYACRQIIPRLVAAGWGRVVNIASIAGKEGNPNAVPYSASKAGVIGLTKAMAKEVATCGVLVNCVTPAVIDTPILKGLTPQHVEYMTSRIPMQRVGQPSEVAALVSWLVSEECSFSTGAVFDISGGRATY